jgi:probable rRNA maturation factor
MADHLDVVVEDVRWSDLDLDALTERAVAATFTLLNMDREGYEISVLACDDAAIAELNAEFRGKPVATNVLSWPAFDLAPEQAGGIPREAPEPDTGPFETGLGDIAISFDTSLREAEEQQITTADHVVHLMVHATLHLLGYDHETDADAERMEALEIKVLETLNIANPY